MNDQISRNTTRAAEGLPRRRWTVREIEQLAELGIFGGIDREEERFELIGGEIVPMSPKGRRHENVRTLLSYALTRLAPPEIMVAAETQFNLSDDAFTVPDILLYPRTLLAADVRPKSALLIVEVAVSSYDHDIELKGPLYAAAGLAEYWVVKGSTLETRVHRVPAGGVYGSISTVPVDGFLTPQLIPELSLSLAIALAELGWDR